MSTPLNPDVRITNQQPRGQDAAADGEQFEALLDALPDPVLVLVPQRDDSGAITAFEIRSANAAALRAYGGRKADVVGHELMGLVPWLSESRQWADFVASVSAGEPASMDMPWLDAAGQRRRYELTAAAYDDGLIVTARDVTERVAAQDQLRRERDFISATLDVVGALVMVLDSDGRILRFNRASELMTGYREANVLGRTWEFLVPPGEREQVAADLARPSGPAPSQQVNHYLTKDGELRPVRWSAVPLAAADGRSTQIIATGIDIAAQVRTEERLRRESDLIDATLSVAGALIVVLDADGHVVRFNRQAELLTGYREADVIGRHYEFVIAPDERAEVAATLENVSADAPVSQENHYLTKDGALRLMRWSYAALFDAQGRRTHLVGVGVDITDQRRAEEEVARRSAQLEAVNRELDRSNKDLERFAFVASHDLAEPLRAISAPITYLGDRYKGKLDERADQLIEFALGGCRRMQSMIDGLLAFSRVGQFEAAVVPTDAGLAATKAVAALGSTVDDTGAVVSIESLPTVLAEPQLLSQVFQNLIGNAIKFVAPGVVPRVSVSAERAGNTWRFDVIDNGIGIDPADRERVFTMFSRLHSSEDYPGTGIGLAVVKKIVDRLGGQIGIDTAPSGSGSRVWFTVPESSPAT